MTGTGAAPRGADPRSRHRLHTSTNETFVVTLRRQTSDRFRDGVDRGGAGDKVDARDPAAVPPRADDETAGQPPADEETRVARTHETGQTRMTRLERSRRIYGMAAALVGIVAVAGIVLLLL